MAVTRLPAAVGLLLAGVMLAGCAPTGAAAEWEPLPEALERIVAGWHERAWVPGVAVSVRQGDTLSWAGAAGYADEESETPMSPSMPTFVASVTKPFVAATVLRLAEDGRLGLDDPLERYVPDFPRAADLTIRQLLGMRSGVPDYTRAWGFIDGLEEDLRHRRETHWTPAQLLAVAAEAPPDFAPGERHAYSNTNYILLGEVISAATGRPWWEVLDELVARPLGLTDTALPVGGAPPTTVTGYADLDRDASRDSLAGRPFGSIVSSAGAAGGLVSTAEDLTAFARGALGGGLLSESSIAAMSAVPRVGYERTYGLGVTVHLPDLRTKVIGHTGSMIGYSSLVWYAPGHDLAVAVLVNDGMAAPEDLAELLLRRVLRD